MKRSFNLFLVAFATFLTSNSFAQVDSGSYFLHKFAQNIGKETFVRTTTGNKISYDVDFKFTDRGQAVPLKARMVTTTNHDPLSLYLKGSTSRFSTIDDSVVINNGKANLLVDKKSSSQKLLPNSFPIGGYSPGTVQMALIKYWKSHKQPGTINMLPTGTVSIRRDGWDTLGPNLILERNIVSGLIWGNEIVWTEPDGNIICLITNDAEGDKLEMVNTTYESLLPEFIDRAAVYGMKLFSNSMKLNTASEKRPVAIVGGNIVDVVGFTVLPNTIILIEADTIKAVDFVGKMQIPANARVINATGKTIIPGLWDMHSHFEQAEWGPAYLAAGVTTVRDCGNEFVYINAIKSAIDSKKGIGPNIIKAGIIDGPGPFGLGIVRAATKEEGVKAVNMYKDNGFSQIKIYSSITPDVLKAICDEAHRLNLTVTGHIPMNMSTQAGIDSGMDMINHMQYVASMMKRNKDRSIDLNDSTSQAAFDFLRKHGTVVDPTMGVYEMIFRNTSEDIHVMEPNFDNLPLPLQTLFGNTGMPDSVAKANASRYKSMFALVKALRDKGIPFFAGTDMGFPGYSVARELELYVQAGLSPFEAIQTATITPAIIMHMDHDYGSLRWGKKADLVILDADPTVNIRNIRKVNKVFKDGVEYDPHVLHKMVGFKN